MLTVVAASVAVGAVAFSAVLLVLLLFVLFVLFMLFMLFVLLCCFAVAVVFAGAIWEASGSQLQWWYTVSQLLF